MSTTRKIVLGAALGLATFGVAGPVHAAEAPSASSPDAMVEQSDHDQVAGKKKCRWVWGKGVVCTTPWGTITL